MIIMEVKEKNNSTLNKSRTILFGFELNRSQTVLILISSFIGLFTISYELFGFSIFYLIYLIFGTLPDYLSNPEQYLYHVFIYNFALTITKIVVSIIFLYLSIITLKRILKIDNNKIESNRKIIHQDRIVNWLGFKLSHDQSILVFCLSLAGILFTAQFFIASLTPPLYMPEMCCNTIMKTPLEDLCCIPIGPNWFRSHELLINYARIVLSGIFLILFFYSLITTRREKPITPNKKIAKTYGLLVFIASIIIFLLYLTRFFCHIFLFTELAHILGINPIPTNSYQTNDFINVITILIISLSLLIGSYFIKESPHKEIKLNESLTWFHIKLTPKKAIFLLSLSILFIFLFGYTFLTEVFITNRYFRLYFPNFLFLIIPYGLIIILCYYTIDKIVKRGRLDKFIESIEDSKEITTRWFKFNLTHLYSLIFFSLSIGFLIIFIYQLMGFRIVIEIMQLDPNIAMYSLLIFISYMYMVIILGLFFIATIYTIKQTIPSIKSR